MAYDEKRAAAEKRAEELERMVIELIDVFAPTSRSETRFTRRQGEAIVRARQMVYGKATKDLEALATITATAARAPQGFVRPRRR